MCVCDLGWITKWATASAPTQSGAESPPIVHQLVWSKVINCEFLLDMWCYIKKSADKIMIGPLRWSLHYYLSFYLFFEK